MREAPFSKGVLSIIIIKLLYEYHGYVFGLFIMVGRILSVRNYASCIKKATVHCTVALILQITAVY